jgi:hypothetical protein
MNLRDGPAFVFTVLFEGDTITFGPGNGKGLIEAKPGEQYSWTNGSLILKGHRVYITGMTPLNYTLKLAFA